eukprot:gnl/TRDRNA2_/TRDRNA2_86385_c0_seq1.p1 gnl/TRDRNA2_/TRDRNA2_86385_c0~~gnl/TRDRNA2_/TRDRNA2_86385_c0_seq1.p1  ORF type:complete len:208 (-),score=18.14 gnl/TRDRNA2_/TRDRNA2_86385_c0_seq1:48-671(-)
MSSNGDIDVFQDSRGQLGSHDPRVERIAYVGAAIKAGPELVAHVYSVIHANTSFYEKFRSGRCSRATVAEVFDQPSATTVVHPLGTRLHGEDCLASFQDILGRSGFIMSVKCIKQRWTIDDHMAMVVCGEDFGTNIVECTNIFVLRNGAWRMVHHHGSHPMPPPMNSEKARTTGANEEGAVELAEWVETDEANHEPERVEKKPKSKL